MDNNDENNSIKYLDIKELESKYNIDFSELTEYYSVVEQIFNSEFIEAEKYDTDNVTILLLIANYYQLVQKNDIDAIKYFELASEKGSGYAMEELGNYYAKIGNEELMVKYYEMAILNEQTDLIVKLGLYYKNKKEYELMKKYFELGIEKSDPDSMYQLGLYYYFTGKDNELAKKYYLMASEQLHPDALFELAKFYKYIEKDVEEYKKYLELSIEKGCELAIMFAAEKESSYSKKKQYLEMACSLGNVKAMYELSNLLWKRERNEQKERIKELLTTSANLGHVESAYQLGAYYKEVEPNPELSFKYFGISAEKDFVEALFALGNMCIEKKEYDTGVKYYERAIKQGHIRSMYNLGIYYQTVVKNSSMSVLYFQRASDKGLIEATKKLYFHYKNTEPNEKLKKKYMEILEKKEREIMMKNMAGHGLNSVMSLFGMFMD